MKKLLAIFLLSLVGLNLPAQTNVDSLRQVAEGNGEDSSRLKSLSLLSRYYIWTIPDSTIYYSKLGLFVAEKLDKKKEQRDFYFWAGEALSGKGNYALALESQLKGLELAEQLRDTSSIAWSIVGTGSVYFYSHDYKTALSYYKKLKNYPIVYSRNEVTFSCFIGEAYFHIGELDSSTKYIDKSLELGKPNPIWPVPFFYKARILAAEKNYASALEFCRTAISISKVPLNLIEGFNRISEIFEMTGILDSAVFYARKSLSLARQLSFAERAIESGNLLKNVFKKLGKTDSAFKYQEIMMNAKDSLYSQEKVRELQFLAFKEEKKREELIADKLAYRGRVRFYGAIAAGIIFLIIAGILWRTNKRKQKDKLKVEQAYNELKNTQSQLIQSEKMASLGQLTAGIAHEIQNPLNFVNNFSDVSTELLEEMKEQLASGNVQQATEIAEDVKNNLEKIVHHGRRADSIVKGMLQHSRSSSIHKEATDINTLAEEYIRLAFHGLRAKDNSINITLKTDFDPAIAKIAMIPQDIGRVLVNLLNNAFYAVNEKNKKGANGYEPKVIVATKKMADGIELRVTDNGSGIPAEALEKIFQPFFTTKPTGQGTGLGLSLSYDIVKAHGGELKVETKEGSGMTFIIKLPAT